MKNTDFLPDGYSGSEENFSLSPETRRAVDIAREKWDKCVEAVEELHGRVYRDDQMLGLLSIKKEAGVEFVMMGTKPILKFMLDREGELRTTKLYS